MKQQERKTVCAVIVTYNRKEYLEFLITALRKQTLSLDAILVYDNSSNDGTEKMLLNTGFSDSAEINLLHEKNSDIGMTIYYRNSENCGGAGGFHNAMEIAVKAGYDYLWVMDDDVFPKEDCLERLMSHMTFESRICVPCRTDERFCDYAITSVNMSNPFAIREARKNRIKSDDIFEEYIEVTDIPFEGPLIDASLVKEIGLPEKDFFIIMDDTDYAQRAIKKTKILYIKDAILHKQIIPKKESGRLMGWKDYYSYRNHIWYDRTYAKNIFVKFLRPRLMIADLVLRAIVKCKWSNLKVLKKAYFDGKNGRLGKTVEPGTQGRDFQ